jgi:hypothetical protein
MENGKEKHCEAADWAELNKPMPEGTKFIRPALLVVFRIVGKDDESLGR